MYEHFEIFIIFECNTIIFLLFCQTITCDCEGTPALQLKCVRQKGDKVETSHYRANINRFRARLNIFCVTEKLQAELKCDGWPDIKVGLAQVGNIKSNLDETHLQDLIRYLLILFIYSCNTLVIVLNGISVKLL